MLQVPTQRSPHGALEETRTETLPGSHVQSSLKERGETTRTADSTTDTERHETVIKFPEPGVGIADIISSNMEKSKFTKTDERIFLPRDIIERLFDDHPLSAHDTRSSREMIMEAMDIEEIDAMVESLLTFISKSAKSVFLTAVYIGPKKLYEIMVLFQKQDFTDQELPNPRHEQHSNSDPHLFRQWQRSSKKPLWSVTEIQQFETTKWAFLAPIVDSTDAIDDLGMRVMPFVGKNSKTNRGGTGIVHEYTVHRAHTGGSRMSPGGSPLVVAVKHIGAAVSKGRVTYKWSAEKAAMVITNNLRQPHILRFISAFRHGMQPDLEYFVMSEWAHGGNLKDFFKTCPNETPTAELNESIVRQLSGLAEALNAVHYLRDKEGRLTNSSCRHGDLKPENILWFPNDGIVGTFKIGDWGEAKEHSMHTAIRQDTSASSGTRRYAPPEVYMADVWDPKQVSKKARSRLCDLWGFGCIALEFMIWLLYGFEELNWFDNLSKRDPNASGSFWAGARGEVPRVDDDVARVMNHMAMDACCCPNTTALGRVLEIIRDGLLVVKLPSDGGSLRVREIPKQSKKTASGTSRTRAFPSKDAPDTRKLQDKANDRAPSVSGPEREATKIALEEQRQLVIRPNDDPKVPSIEGTHTEESTDMARDQNPPPMTGIEDEGLVRIRADELSLRLKAVLNIDRHQSYWFQRKTLPKLSVSIQSLTSTRKAIRNQQRLLAPDEAIAFIPGQLDYQHPELNASMWDFNTGNLFAEDLFSRAATNGIMLPVLAPATKKLCDECLEFHGSLTRPRFEMRYKPSYLLANFEEKSCELCRLFWETYQDNLNGDSDELVIKRENSTLMLGDGTAPVLSLFQYYAPSGHNNSIQIGFPVLSKAGQGLHIQIVRAWLADCDKKHLCCKDRVITARPKRLIDVREPGAATVYLIESTKDDTGDWVALSYRWGAQHPMFTDKNNIQEHMDGMKLDSMPATFKDAVNMTRAIGKPYLWIDSLCIQQGEGGDFNTEADRMEDVFSGAYCVFAATCADDQKSGFLRTPNERDYVALDPIAQGLQTTYVCRNIDNFGSHVLESKLSQRAWVLQEHALARRTIFFTEHQTYWQCGKGVRCQTMTEMVNEAADLLGDSSFPRILDSAQYGERTIRFQKLYQQYSRCKLSQIQDRPKAIAGLQHRLLSTTQFDGDHGVFDDDGHGRKGLLRRSLLWHRTLDGSTETLTKIVFSKDRETVPSWSWMAVSGGIDYFRLEFPKYDWKDVKSQWTRGSEPAPKNRIVADAQGYNQALAGSLKNNIIFDDPCQAGREKAKVIVLGVEKEGKVSWAKTNFVLVVIPEAEEPTGGLKLCRRIGAGYLPGCCLDGRSERYHIV